MCECVYVRVCARERERVCGGAVRNCGLGEGIEREVDALMWVGQHRAKRECILRLIALHAQRLEHKERDRHKGPERQP